MADMGKRRLFSKFWVEWCSVFGVQLLPNTEHRTPAWQAIGGAMLILLLSACGSAESFPTFTADQRALTIEVAPQINAGASVTIAVRGDDLSAASPVLVHWKDSYRNEIYRGDWVDGEVQVLVEDTTVAGLVSLTAVSGERRGSAEIQILPGSPAEPLRPLIGPKSIIVGGEDASMGIVVPSDQYGNPVSDGTAITMQLFRPDGSVDGVTAATEHLIASAVLKSATESGVSQFVVSAGRTNGLVNQLREVPAEAWVVNLIDDGLEAAADGRTLVTLKTDFLRDRFGNLLADGTLVQFVVSGANSHSILPAESVGGLASTTIQAPTEPEEMTIFAIVDGQQSAPLSLTFTPFVEPFRVAVSVQAEQNGILVDAGSFADANGGLIADGTVVEIVVARDGEVMKEVSAETFNGRLSHLVLLKDPLSGSYDVTVSLGGRSSAAGFKVDG